MDYYPPALLFAAKRLQNFKRNLAEVYPTGIRTANPEDYTEFRFTDAVIDLSTLRILGDILLIRPVGTENTLRCLARDIESYVDYIQVLINDVEVDSCPNFAHLWRLLIHMSKSNASQRGCLQLGNDFYAASQNTLPAIGTASTSAGSSPGTGSVPGLTSHRWMLKDIPGFLSSGKILDLTYLGTLKIRIRWITGDVVHGSVNDTYQMQNLRCIVGTITYADDTYSMLMEKTIEATGLYIPYKRYQSERYEPLLKSTQCKFAVRTKSLDAIFCVLNTPGTQNVYSSSTNYFDRQIEKVKSVYFQIESEFYPKFPITPEDSYAIADICLTDTSQGLFISSWAEWLYDVGFWMFRWNYSEDSQWVSGLSKAGDENINGSVILRLADAEVVGNYGTPILFFECGSIVHIGPNRVVTLMP